MHVLLTFNNILNKNLMLVVNSIFCYVFLFSKTKLFILLSLHFSIFNFDCQKIKLKTRPQKFNLRTLKKDHLQSQHFAEQIWKQTIIPKEPLSMSSFSRLKSKAKLFLVSTTESHDRLAASFIKNSCNLFVFIFTDAPPAASYPSTYMSSREKLRFIFMLQQ